MAQENICEHVFKALESASVRIHRTSPCEAISRRSDITAADRFGIPKIVLSATELLCQTQSLPSQSEQRILTRAQEEHMFTEVRQTRYVRRIALSPDTHVQCSSFLVCFRVVNQKDLRDRERTPRALVDRHNEEEVMGTFVLYRREV